MRPIFVDATTLIALGTIGELELLEAFDGRCVVLPSIRDEVTGEPAATNLAHAIESEFVTAEPGVAIDDRQAQSILDEPTVNGDVRLIGAVLAHRELDGSVGVISDDRRVRTVARGLGADVTGTIGVIVRCVEEGLPGDDAKEIIRRVDGHGLHMTAELRETAVDLVESAAE